MKRNNLTTALLAGLAGAAGLASTAGAVSLNPDGLGQVLVYPYYTVNSGNQTLISVVNTTDRAKAVKVRFLEGRNSKEVLDFNLYLSAFDSWSGAVFATGSTGPGNLLTRDESCTVPDIIHNTGSGTGVTAGGDRFVPFRNIEYSNIGASLRRDHPAALAGTLSALERTREGHVELIEMGELESGGDHEEAATHDGGVPNSCAFLRGAWAAGGSWRVGAGLPIDIPNGGLYGHGEIVDVANGTAVSYNADAIEGFYTVDLATIANPGLHAQPGSTFPNLAQARNAATTATAYIFSPLTNTITSETFTVGALPNAISLLYQHDAVMNDYVTEDDLAADSEWVVTFPTKRFYVDSATVATLPFTDPFRDDGAACEPVDITYWDREETESFEDDNDFSPRIIQGRALCYEAQVVTFNQGNLSAGSAVLGSTYAVNINSFENGWARLSFPVLTTPANGHTLAGATVRYVGLPVTGFWAATYVNSAAQPGMLANFAATHRHKASRAVQ